jgi:hypothetical protein
LTTHHPRNIVPNCPRCSKKDRGKLMPNNRRRVALVLAAAAGGLLSAALLPAPLAFADDYANEPGSAFELVGQDGFPPLYAQDSGVQLFDVVDTTDSPTGDYDVVGQYDALVTNTYGPSGSLFNQEETVVGQSASGPNGTDPGDEPNIGSVFDTTNFGGGFENEYSDLVAYGAGAKDVITDTFVTPFGDFNIPTTFDLASILGGDTGFGFLGDLAFNDFGFIGALPDVIQIP